jgi:hypothetical protein
MDMVRGGILETEEYLNVASHKEVNENFGLLNWNVPLAERMGVTAALVMQIDEMCGVIRSNQLENGQCVQSEIACHSWRI